jgi:hypothetical protein
MESAADPGDFPIAGHASDLAFDSRMDDRLNERPIIKAEPIVSPVARAVPDAPSPGPAHAPEETQDAVRVPDAHNVAPTAETASNGPSADSYPYGAQPHRHKGGEYTVVSNWSESEIADARIHCTEVLQGIGLTAEEAEPVKEGACGAPAPLRVRRIGSGNAQVDLEPSVMLTCDMAAALHTWITKEVQPAAQESFGKPVVRLISASSYACRNRYGRSDAPLSEHALVNALDLSGFVLSDGRTVRVLEGWGPDARDAKKLPVQVAAVVSEPVPKKQLPKTGLSMLGAAKEEKSDKPGTADPNAKAGPADASIPGAQPGKDPKAVRAAFLRKVHDSACGVFGTVLGPEANDAHRDHFHLDMKARRHKAYCE